MAKRNAQDLVIRNLHAQKKVNETLKARIARLSERMAALERALRFVMRSTRAR